MKTTGICPELVQALQSSRQCEGDNETLRIAMTGMDLLAVDPAITALRVIHTWATFDGGRCLNPQDVAKITRKALKGFISSSPDKEAHQPRRGEA
jgi:hypothetical protein